MSNAIWEMVRLNVIEPKKINEQNNGCARALQFLVHFFAVLGKTTA